MEHYFTNNKNLKENINEINAKVKDIELVFYTDNGVFMVSMGILFGGVLAISLLCENSYRRKYSCTVKSLIITIVMLM